MKVLVVGSGAREHALCWGLQKSPGVEEVLAAPGNGGIAAVARCCDVAATDVQGLVELAASESVDLVVVGPEAPLAMGLVDRLTEREILAFGPTAAAAELETSKVFTKELCREWGIPTAASETFEDPDEAREYLRGLPAEEPVVIKADGLAAGKGVIIAADRDEALAAVDRIMEDRAFGGAGDRILVEEFLVGQEVSLMAFVDGGTVAPMVVARDHKRAYDGDEGPNTGGMGTFSPVPDVGPDVVDRALREIVEPAVRAMVARDTPFQGVLFAGLMITADGPKLIEFNVRFGDPETQVVLPRLQTDLLEVLLATAEGRLKEVNLTFSDAAAVCVVLASGGYPGSYPRGLSIDGLESVKELVFHAGTVQRGDELVTAGGRVLSVVGLGRDLSEARALAYAGADTIHFEGKHLRRDIAR